MNNKIKNNICQLIGNTPIVQLDNTNLGHSQNVNIFAKIESANPTGSIKDRAAYFMVQDAKTKGLINADTTIVEPTSGNTGIALACICRSEGIKCTIVMPDNMSVERIQTMKAFGADVQLTPADKGMQGAIDFAEQLANKDKNALILGQFNNNANTLAHYKTTAPEIYEQLEGKVDVFVAGVGTGGTLIGCAKYLKEQNPNIKIVAVEPYSSPVLTAYFNDMDKANNDTAKQNAAEQASTHKIAGIGANFVPDLIDIDLIDEVIRIKDEDAINWTKRLANDCGIFAGISSGAAVAGCIEVAKSTDSTQNIATENSARSLNTITENSDNKLNIATVLPDGGWKYLSNNIFG